MTIKPSYPAKRSFAVANRQNYLRDKVVLLIGNDMSIVQRMITQLTHKGADVALICQMLPHETLRFMREGVEAVGRRLLVIEEIEYKHVSAEWLVQTVIAHLGGLDIFIDVSAATKKRGRERDREEENGLPQTPEFSSPRWALMEAAFQEIGCT